MIDGEETRCDVCNKVLQLSEHPFCPHGFGKNARIHDDIPGGMVFENLGPHPVKVYSMTEYHRICKQQGVQPKEKFCPTPGTDIDPAGIPNPKGYMDPYTLAAGAELIMRNGQKSREFDAVEDGVIRNQQSGHLTERDAIAVASGDSHRQARLGRRMRG